MATCFLLGGTLPWTSIKTRACRNGHGCSRRLLPSWINSKISRKFCNLAAIHVHPFPTERISSEQFCNQTYSDFWCLCVLLVFLLEFFLFVCLLSMNKLSVGWLCLCVLKVSTRYIPNLVSTFRLNSFLNFSLCSILF